MNYEQMEQLKNDVHEELRNAVNNSKLGDIFQKYGVLNNKAIQFDCILDLTKIQFNGAIRNDQPQSERVTVACCGQFPPCFCCSC